MILAAKYIAPVSSPVIKDAAILVRNDKIFAIDTLEALVDAHPLEEVINYEDAILMPGFVDTHTRLEYSMLRGVTGDLPYAQWRSKVSELGSLLSKEDWDNAALLGALEALSCGITTVADTTRTGASLRAAQEIGMRGIFYREFGTIYKKEGEQALSLADADIQAWRKLTQENDLIQVGISPDAVHSTHPSVLALTSEYASDGTPVALRLASSKEEYDFVRYGSSPYYSEASASVAYEASWLPAGTSPVRYILNWKILDVPNILAIHCTQVDESDVRFLAGRDVSVAWCPRSNARLGMGAAPIRMFHENGVRVGIATGSPAANTSMSQLSELRNGLYIQRSLDAKCSLTTNDMLRIGTFDGARALKLDDKIGTIEVGKQADIIVADLSEENIMEDPIETLIYNCSKENIRMTMVAGKILYQDRGFPFFKGEERLLARREEIHEKIASAL